MRMGVKSLMPNAELLAISVAITAKLGDIQIGVKKNHWDGGNFL